MPDQQLPDRRSSERTRPLRLGAAGLGLLALLAVLLGVGLAPEPDPLETTDRVVVVAAGGLTLESLDPVLLDAGPAAAGTVSTGRTPPPGGCGARGWAVLSTGAPVADVGACTVTTDSAGGVADWRERVAAAPGLGRLGESPRCITAVGTAASLGAVRADGTVAESLAVTDWQAAGYATSCPVALVDGEELFGSDLRTTVTDLAAQPGTQVWVVSTSPGPLRTGSAPQPVVVLGAGIVDGVLVGAGGGQPSLTDVAATLHRIAGAAPETGAPGTGADGTGAGPGTAAAEDAGMAVRPWPVSADSAQALVQDRIAVADPSGVWVGLGVAWGLLVLTAVVTGRDVAPRRPLSWQPLLSAALPAGVQLTGLLAWWRLPDPAVVLVSVLLAVGLALLARGAAPRLGAPPWLLAGVLSLSVLALSLLGSDVLGAGLPGGPTGPLSPLPGRAPLAAVTPSLVVGGLLVLALGLGMLRHPLSARRAGAGRSAPDLE